MSTEANTNRFDSIKWLISAILIAASVYGNHYFADESVLIRAVSILVILGIALFVASQTEKGQQAVQFAKESRMEVRKVVWPTRPEAIQTTVIIVIFVGIISLFLWAVDASLAFGIDKIMSF
ncbi:preprotein translocase subunit SecE [Pleionea sp. CnH1-48]|uniref:preprotein translocase subunit SecE n=1 Tax=Pleionea sp. CnH1-48 TaxID=2954494 RepID=UPI00209791F1|nr:preprotein translocase subunit SecE [Pleionea sp. CnH1-48]